jgi:hypothetical protein
MTYRLEKHMHACRIVPPNQKDMPPTTDWKKKTGIEKGSQKTGIEKGVTKKQEWGGEGLNHVL